MKKKKLDQYLPHLFLLGVVAIVAIVALVLHGNGTTGAATTSCTDTEPGNDRYIAGTVRVIDGSTGTVTSWPDGCNGDMLQQWECASQGLARQLPDRMCPPKICEAGEVCTQGKLCDRGVCLYEVELSE